MELSYWYETEGQSSSTLYLHGKICSLMKTSGKSLQ